MDFVPPKKVIGIVDRIVEKYRLLLRYMTLGPAALTKEQIKLLLKEGMLRPKYYRATLVDAYLTSYQKLLTAPPLKSISDFTIKHIQQTAGNLIDKFADNLSQDVGSILNRHILNYSKQLRDYTKEELVEGMLKEKTISEMVQSLRDKTQDYYKDFSRIIKTETSRAHNLGSLDAILVNNADKSQSEIFVYMNGSIHRRCKHCARLYYWPDGKPRVFKLSELLASGSNYGKKASEWQACVGPLHPNCTDVMLELPSGYGFHGTKLVYISKDHDEYIEQNQ